MTYVPQIKCLRVNQILQDARKYFDIDTYISDIKDAKLSSRDDIINEVKRFYFIIFEVNTLISEKLQSMVNKVKPESEAKYINKRGFTMKVLSKLHRIFSNVKEVSSMC